MLRTTCVNLGLTAATLSQAAAQSSFSIALFHRLTRKRVDELFVQTITFNSPEFQSRTSNFRTRLIDWKRGKPYVWRIEDIPEIMRSDALFCRKFDMRVDSEIVNSIADWLLKDKE